MVVVVDGPTWPVAGTGVHIRTSTAATSATPRATHPMPSLPTSRAVDNGCYLPGALYSTGPPIARRPPLRRDRAAATLSVRMRRTASGSRVTSILALAGLSLLFVSGVARSVDPDMWHGIALIRETLALGHLPLEDHFAYTPTVYPVVHHEWAEAAIVYFAVTRGGLAGLLALRWLLTIGIAGGAFALARRRGASLAVLSVLAPIAIFMSWIGMTVIRAQVFTLLFLVVLLWCLEADRRGRRGWVLPWLAVYVLWLNCHGGFVVGLVLFWLHTVEQAARRKPVIHLLLVGIAMVALIAANPYGYHYFPYLWRALRLDRSLVSEWLPLWAGGAPTLLPFAVSLLVLAYGLATRGFRDAPGWPLVLFTAWAALSHQRHLSIYAVVWLCDVPALIEPTRLGAMLHGFWTRRLAPVALWGLVTALGCVAVVRQRPWQVSLPANPGEHSVFLYPVGVVDYLRETGFRGNLMVPFEVGAFVTWKLHPAVKVSFDGRFEAAYPVEALAQNVALYDGAPGWRDLLTRYPTDAVLVPRDAVLATKLAEDGSWRLAYEDDAYEVYARPDVALPRADHRGHRLVASFP